MLETKKEKEIYHKKAYLQEWIWQNVITNQVSFRYSGEAATITIYATSQTVQLTNAPSSHKLVLVLAEELKLFSL